MSLSNSLLIGGRVDLDVLYDVLVLLSSLYPEIICSRLCETILFACGGRNNPLIISLFIKEVCHIPFDVLVLCCISELWPEEVLEEDVLVLTSS